MRDLGVLPRCGLRAPGEVQRIVRATAVYNNDFDLLATERLKRCERGHDRLGLVERRDDDGECYGLHDAPPKTQNFAQCG